MGIYFNILIVLGVVNTVKTTAEEHPIAAKVITGIVVGAGTIIPHHLLMTLPIILLFRHSITIIDCCTYCLFVAIHYLVVPMVPTAFHALGFTPGMNKMSG